MSRDIPVAAVQQIGEEYGKQFVILFAFDESANMLNRVTWGQDAPHKELAVEMSERCVNLAFAGVGPTELLEDFREPSEAAKIKEDLDKWKRYAGYCKANRDPQDFDVWHESVYGKR